MFNPAETSEEQSRRLDITGSASTVEMEINKEVKSHGWWGVGDWTLCTDTKGNTIRAFMP